MYLNSGNVRRREPTVITVPRGPTGPSGAGATAYEATFASPLSEWVVNHNLGYYPLVQPVNLARQEIEADVDYLSINIVRVRFSTPFAGYLLYK